METSVSGQNLRQETPVLRTLSHIASGCTCTCSLQNDLVSGMVSGTRKRGRLHFFVAVKWTDRIIIFAGSALASLECSETHKL